MFFLRAAPKAGRTPGKVRKRPSQPNSGRMRSVCSPNGHSRLDLEPGAGTGTRTETGTGTGTRTETGTETGLELGLELGPEPELGARHPSAAPGPSVTRSCSMWKPPHSPSMASPDSPSSRTAPEFPRKLPGGCRATRAGSWSATARWAQPTVRATAQPTPRAAARAPAQGMAQTTALCAAQCWTRVARPARFPQHFAVHSMPGTAAAASPPVGSASRTPTTSCTGRTAERPRWAIPCCCVALTIAGCTRAGYRVCIDRNGQVVFFTPKGKALFQAPPLPELTSDTPDPPDLLEALVRGNRERGVTPDGSSCGPKWSRDSYIPWAIEAAARDAIDPWEEPSAA